MHKSKLAVLFGLLAIAGALSFGANVRAGTPIDLNGDWTVMVEGDVTVKCTGSAQQSGSDVNAVLKCPGAFFDTRLYGEVDLQSRELSLDLDGEQGLDINLEGTVSADGDSVDGTWEWSGGDLAGTFHATRGSIAQPRPNIIGSWDIQTSDGPDGQCSGDITDDVAVVQLDLHCPNSPATTFTGNLSGRTLTLHEGQDTITATVTADGIALAGWWAINGPCCNIGSFSGIKRTDHGFDGDATGDWTATLAAGLFPPCDVAVEQLGDELFAAFDCGLVGGYWLRGPIDPETATFELEGVAGSEKDIPVTVRGLISEDGQSFAGTASGITVEGHRIDDTPSFIDANGMNELHLNSTLGEEVVCSFNVQQEFEVLTAVVRCPGVGDGRLIGWLSPLTGELSLLGDVGGASLTLDGTLNDSHPNVFEGKWDSDRRYVSGCFTTSLDADCQQSPDVPGDANCDGRTNSLDAALVLQVSAGLITYIDLCFDGSNVADLRDHCCQVVINAVDAALILQISAGLLGRLAG